MSAAAGTEKLARVVQQAQRDHRVPALAAAVHRLDRPLWTVEVGGTGNDTELTAGSQFRIGSVTKTFTAVMVMQCRDEGLLDLDDPLSAHLPGLPRHGDLTVRTLLSHTSGLQREPFGDVWTKPAGPDTTALLADLVRAERVLPAERRWHYSNLGYTLLGELVAAKRRAPWAEVLADRILEPFGLSGTTVGPSASAVVGYLVDAYSDHARPEPRTDLAGIAAAGQLWSTATDMARWAAFLTDPAAADPKAEVLAASTVEEMRTPRAVTDPELWHVGFGLGIIVVPQGDRVVHAGHDGAMPGFLASVYGRRGGPIAGASLPAGLGAAVLGSSGTAAEAVELVHALLAATVEHDPPAVEAWQPGDAAPAEYRGVLGRWWGEGFGYVFRWREGRLEASAALAPDRPPAVFAPEGTDVLRGVAGREVGEQLRLVRDGTGQVVELYWATYRFTRNQQTFDGIPASEP